MRDLILGSKFGFQFESAIYSMYLYFQRQIHELPSILVDTSIKTLKHNDVRHLRYIFFKVSGWGTKLQTLAGGGDLVNNWRAHPYCLVKKLTSFTLTCSNDF